VTRRQARSSLDEQDDCEHGAAEWSEAESPGQDSIVRRDRRTHKATCLGRWPIDNEVTPHAGRARAVNLDAHEALGMTSD